MSEPHLVANSFTSYSLSPEQERVGASFSTEQLMYLHNQLAQIAEQKIQLEVATEDFTAFVQQDAYLRGQLDILRHLIDTSIALQKTTTIIED